MEVVDQLMFGVLCPHPACYGIGIVLVAVPSCAGKVAFPQRSDKRPVPLCWSRRGAGKREEIMDWGQEWSGEGLVFGKQGWKVEHATEQNGAA